MRNGKTLVRKTTKSIVSYYLNPAVTIVSRVKAYARRLRLRGKLYNQVHYTGEDITPEHAVSTERLENDAVDYIKVATQLGQELLTKVTFLSNNDAICIFDILTRIRKPLDRLCQNRRKSVSKDTFDHANTSIDKNHTGANHENIEEALKPLTLLRNVQKKILLHVLGDERCSGISKRNRYYLICALSRDCSLVTVQQWRMLFEHVIHAFETPNVDIYTPFEIANLLLVYNQISKWVVKRESKTSQQTCYNEVLAPGKFSNALQLRNVVDLGVDFLNRNAFYNGLEKLVPNVSQLTFDKIIKLLYLQCSIRLFNVNFFVSTIDFLHIAKILNHLHWNEIVTCIKLYNRAVWFHLEGELECLKIDVGKPELEKVFVDGLLDSGPNSKPSPENYTNLNDRASDLQLRSLFVKVEKLYLGLIYVLVGYTRRYLGSNEKALDADAISLLLKKYGSNTSSALTTQIKELVATTFTVDSLRDNTRDARVAPAERHLLDIVTILSTIILWNSRLCTNLKPERKFYNIIYERGSFLIETTQALLNPILYTSGLVFSHEERLVRIHDIFRLEAACLTEKDTRNQTNNPSDVEKTWYSSTQVSRKIVADVTMLLENSVGINR